MKKYRYPKMQKTPKKRKKKSSKVHLWDIWKGFKRGLVGK